MLESPSQLEEQTVKWLVNLEAGDLGDRPILRLLQSARTPEEVFDGLMKIERQASVTLAASCKAAPMLRDVISRGGQWPEIFNLANAAVDRILTTGKEKPGKRDEPSVFRLATRAVRGSQTHSQSVPVIVDSVHRGDLVRLNYFYVESNAPLPEWELELGDSEFPFLLINLVGVILQPFGAMIFESSNLIEQLFEVLEDRLGFTVSVGDLWVPAPLFAKKMSTGAVFRMHLHLFRRAYELRDKFGIDAHSGDAQWPAVLPQLREFPVPEFSEKETGAFAEWSEKQVKDAEPGITEDWEKEFEDGLDEF